jgi:hypothetical protein
VSQQWAILVYGGFYKMATRLCMSGMWSDELEAAIKERCTEPYSISFGHNGSDYAVFAAAINIGIDAHLEAVQFTRSGSKFLITPDTLHVLVRRLMNDASEDTQDEAYNFASGICETLDIELV